MKENSICKAVLLFSGSYAFFCPPYTSCHEIFMKCKLKQAYNKRKNPPETSEAGLATVENHGGSGMTSQWIYFNSGYHCSYVLW